MLWIHTVAEILKSLGIPFPLAVIITVQMAVGCGIIAWTMAESAVKSEMRFNK